MAKSVKDDNILAILTEIRLIREENSYYKTKKPLSWKKKLMC